MFSTMEERRPHIISVFVTKGQPVHKTVSRQERRAFCEQRELWTVLLLLFSLSVTLFVNLFSTTVETLTMPVYIIIIINPLTARVVWAPQMILQPVFSIFTCSPLPSGTCRTPSLSIPWCCLPTSSSVCLVFFPLSLCLARWFWPDLMNGKHDHTTTVCVSLRSSGGLRVVQLPAGSWHGLPRR